MAKKAETKTKTEVKGKTPANAADVGKDVKVAEEAKGSEKAAGEKKSPSKTDSFKEHIQRIIYQQLGVKVSRDKAWGLFKAVIHGTVEFVVNLPVETKEGKEGEEVTKERSLPLAGVGTFKILETKPRGSKAGLDKEGNPIEGAVPWPCVPRFRFYPSSKVDEYIEYKYGLGDHTDVKENHYGLFGELTAPEKPVKSEGKGKSKSKKEAVEEDAGSVPDMPEPEDDFDEI